MDDKIGKKGQIALWVIIAIVMFSLVGILFFISKSPSPEVQQGENPQIYIEICAKKAAQEALDIMLPQGGFISPKNYKEYNKKNITYICENEGYFKPCINQHPGLLNDVKKELYDYTHPIIDNCFLDLKDELEKKGKQVSLDDMNLSYYLGPGRVRIYIEREIKITEKDQTQSFKKFDVEFLHPVYDLVNVANDIASQEAKYCYFEYVGYMLIYSNLDIRKVALSDSTKIYTIQDKNSKNELNIALKGCVIPPGI